jgi:NADPH:quinone reductase-like Zn-dependent oxidoreductase
MLERGAVTGHHTVLVTGASGGVGLAAVQLANARGARVVRPVIAATFGLDEVPDAQRQFAQRQHVGKLVVVP